MIDRSFIVKVTRVNRLEINRRAADLLRQMGQHPEPHWVHALQLTAHLIQERRLSPVMEIEEGVWEGLGRDPLELMRELELTDPGPRPESPEDLGRIVMERIWIEKTQKDEISDLPPPDWRPFQK